MLYNLLTNYSDTYSFLNFFNFLTVRTGLAIITAMIIVFLIGDKFINYFSVNKITNPIRLDGPEDHLDEMMREFDIRRKPNYKNKKILENIHKKILQNYKLININKKGDFTYLLKNHD